MNDLDQYKVKRDKEDFEERKNNHGVILQSPSEKYDENYKKIFGHE